MDFSGAHILIIFIISGTSVKVPICLDAHESRWKPFDSARNWPDLGQRFIAGEQRVREELAAKLASSAATNSRGSASVSLDDDKRDLDWSTVLKRTFEAYIREERPNMYGEWIRW